MLEHPEHPLDMPLTFVSMFQGSYLWLGSKSDKLPYERQVLAYITVLSQCTLHWAQTGDGLTFEASILCNTKHVKQCIIIVHDMEG